MESRIGDILHDVQQKVVQAASQRARNDHYAIPRSAESILRAEWPDTWAALTSTYFDPAKIGRTYLRPRASSRSGELEKCNDAGYLLRGLEVMLERATSLYAQFPVRRESLDAAAARETRYQWQRQRQARDMRCYLVTCWLSLLTERPERIWPERYR